MAVTAGENVKPFREYVLHEPIRFMDAGSAEPLELPVRFIKANHYDSKHGHGQITVMAHPSADDALLKKYTDYLAAEGREIASQVGERTGFGTPITVSYSQAKEFVEHTARSNAGRAAKTVEAFVQGEREVMDTLAGIARGAGVALAK